MHDADDKEKSAMAYYKAYWSEVLDPQKLGTRGEAWLVAEIAATWFLVLPPEGLRGAVDVLGWASVLAGCGLMVAAQLELGDNSWSLAKPREGNALVTTGVFERCRHPQYGGLVLFSLGLALATEDSVRMLFALLTILVVLGKAAAEERYLEAAFPEEYGSYKRRTPRLLYPFLL